MNNILFFDISYSQFYNKRVAKVNKLSRKSIQNQTMVKIVYSENEIEYGLILFILDYNSFKNYKFCTVNCVTF